MRRLSTIAAVAGITVVLGAPVAGATGGNDGWVPYRTQPFDAVGRCSFTVHADIVQDEEEVRTDATFPDGSPRIQEFRGPLVIRLTNTANGKSAVRDVSGYGRVVNMQNGGAIWYFGQGVAIGIPIGNKAYPAGYYVVHGRSWYTIRPDGTRDIKDRHADVENMCRTLA
ncbi:hypothetical protein GCM10023191_088210 [Actinoallomurus oryzae]|jgi:hypothetical protein|uniref:Uncharacterized protein n=1 Tax=Actinoallomurus oryzae TaxID=502180 RepID=A0ABP8R330_9ACTN